jgi:hypothetical protein
VSACLRLAEVVWAFVGGAWCEVQCGEEVRKVCRLVMASISMSSIYSAVFGSETGQRRYRLLRPRNTIRIGKKCCWQERCRRRSACLPACVQLPRNHSPHFKSPCIGRLSIKVHQIASFRPINTPLTRQSSIKLVLPHLLHQPDFPARHQQITTNKLLDSPSIPSYWLP